MSVKKIKEQYNVLCCSFGKDSLATAIFSRYVGVKIDEVVYIESIFSHAKNVSCEHPVHKKFIYDKAIPTLRNMGFKVTVIKSELDYVDIFMKRNSSDGLLMGFQSKNPCYANWLLKVQPIKRYLNHLRSKYRVVELVGICSDEVKRAKRLTGEKRSLLFEYGITQDKAKEIVNDVGLLSPIYKLSNRSGCWFCPNASIDFYAIVKTYYPNLWKMLLLLDKFKERRHFKFKYDKTLSEVDKLVDVRILQTCKPNTVSNTPTE